MRPFCGANEPAVPGNPGALFIHPAHAFLRIDGMIAS
jgi:hypothetical protein